MSRTAVGAAIVVLATATPSLARADEDRSLTWAIPGYVYGYVGGNVPARGHGAEVSILHIPDVHSYQGFGILGQLQSYGGTHLRSAIAAEAVYAFFGLEIGWAWRQSDGVHTAQHGLHVSPFVSMGILSLAFRTTVPFGGGADRYGEELAFVLSLKAPVPIHNTKNIDRIFPVFGGNWSAGGRPLRDVDGSSVLPDAIELRRRSRTARDADRWIEQARLEAASIESFLRLADDLCALGAPEDLVVRACRAAEEERRHAELCLERSGAAVRLRGRSTKRRRANVTRLAHEAMQDGVLGEGRAACELLAKSFRARDPYVASVLRGMAIEEASHAQLACDVLEFCAMLGA